MLLGGLPRFQGPGNRLFNALFIVEQYQGKDVDHLPVTAWTLEQACAQLPEAVGQRKKWRTIAQGAGLALYYREIVPPVEDRLPRCAFVPVEHPNMFGHNLGFGNNHQSLWVHAQADDTIGKAGGHAVAVMLEGNQAGG
jgi:hypothetical protein